MNQSTSFAQVANNLLNVLQGYTKGIRFVVVLTMLLTLGAANAWGAAETISVSDFTQCSASEITQSVKGFTFYCENGLIDSDSFRSYSGKIFRITSNVGSMSKIEFTFTSSSANRSWGQGVTTYTVYPNADTWEITGPNQARIKTIVITYETLAASCDKKVSLTKGAETNGTFTLDKANSTYETCDAQLVITLSNITPSTGYQFSEITQSGINSGVTIDQVNKKVTYAQNTSGTSTINVTFTALDTHSVTWKVNGIDYTVGGPTTQVYDGGIVTKLPTAPDPANNCGEVFAGWTTTPIDGTTNIKPSVLFTTAANSPVITGDVTFYAVFAEYAD
jgi:hypothetical protein